MLVILEMFVGIDVDFFLYEIKMNLIIVYVSIFFLKNKDLLKI